MTELEAAYDQLAAAKRTIAVITAPPGGLSVDSSYQDEVLLIRAIRRGNAARELITSLRVVNASSSVRGERG